MKVIFIFLLLLLITFLSSIDLIHFDLRNLFVIVFFVFFILSFVWIILSKDKENKYFLKEFFLISLWFLVSSIFVSNFISGNINGEITYLRVYGQVSFLFFAGALSVSPIISIFKIKDWILKENLILMRKVAWILTFIFLLKHWLSYFIMDYHFYTKYPQSISAFTYIYEHILQRYDALSWIVAWFFVFLLWITSNKSSVRKLWKYWKYLQMLAYPTFIIVLLHIALSWMFSFGYALILFFVVWLRTLAYVLKNKENKNWKVKYLCVPCGYIYDEEKWDEDGWIPSWTKFEDIPDDWMCPVCGVWKKDFIPIYTGEEEIKIEVEVVDKRFLTDDVVELVIAVSKDISSKVWQFAKFILEDRDGEFKRSYSIVEQDWNNLTLCIKALETWRWWKIIRNLKKWDKTNIEWIFWNFVLQDTTNPKVYIATWTGLAPIVNMINHTKSKDNTLFFWLQKSKDLFYLDKILWKENLKTEIFLSKEKTDKYNFWRVDLSKYDFSENTEFYICWNPSMVNSMKKYLTEKWYENIYFEQFV